MKKSALLRQGRIQGLKHAQRIINEFLAQANWDNVPQNSGTLSGNKGALVSTKFSQLNTIEYLDKLLQFEDDEDEDWRGDAENKVEEAMKRGLNIDSIFDKDGNSALSYYIINNEPEKVDILLSLEANPNIRNKDKYGWTPIVTAFACRRISIVKSLLIHGADLKNITFDNKYDEYYCYEEKKEDEEFPYIQNKVNALQFLENLHYCDADEAGLYDYIRTNKILGLVKKFLSLKR